MNHAAALDYNGVCEVATVLNSLQELDSELRSLVLEYEVCLYHASSSELVGTLVHDGDGNWTFVVPKEEA